MIELFDIQAGFGGSAAGVRAPISAAEVVRHLDRHRIDGALMRITPELQDFDMSRSNARLYDACTAHEGLLPCPVVVPAASGDLPPESLQADEAIGHGAMAAVIRPGPDCWEIEPWVVGNLLAVLQQRRLPLVCLERLVPLTAVARLAKLAPELPLIVAEVAYRNHRTLIPLMRTFPNVYLSIGNTFTAHLGVEWYVDRTDPKRLLFGTGLPNSEPGAAIAQLLYADLPENIIALIGAQNARRLQEGIQR